MIWINRNGSSGNEPATRAKVKALKETAGMTLPKNLIEKARKHKLNIIRMAEQALSSIIAYLEVRSTQSSQLLNPCSFQKENGAGPKGPIPKRGRAQTLATALLWLNLIFG